MPGDDWIPLIVTSHNKHHHKQRGGANSAIFRASDHLIRYDQLLRAEQSVQMFALKSCLVSFPVLVFDVIRQAVLCIRRRRIQRGTSVSLQEDCFSFPLS